MPEFVDGSKQAVETVTNYLSKGDFESLESLVKPEELNGLREKIATFSVLQREEIAIKKDDVYFSFPYQVGVMFNENDANQKRFVEITMCYHVLRGLSELKEPPPMNMGVNPDYRDKIHTLNYRFIREFSKGIEDSWTVNKLNHFRPIDQVTY